MEQDIKNENEKLFQVGETFTATMYKVPFCN